MCGRFTLTEFDLEVLAQELGVSPDDFDRDQYRPRYNIAPGQRHWIVWLQREDRKAVPARWGLVNSWAKNAKNAFRQINARAETLDTRPAFRAAFRSRRCLVPADGFLEWTGPKSARQRLWFHRPDGRLIFMAGLYETWYPEPHQPETTFTIVTTAADATVPPVHDRMPVVLDGEAVEEWLFGARLDLAHLQALLAPPPDGLLVATPVNPRVNSAQYDDPACLQPVAVREAAPP